MGWAAPLISIFIQLLAPEIAKFLTVIIESLIKKIQEHQSDPDVIIPIAINIVKGISKSHPDWADELKRATARDAIHQAILDSGGSPSDSIINVLIELAVQYAKAGK